MKSITIILLFLGSISMTSIYAQEIKKEKKMFIRVFDLEGKKIHKGYILFANDSLLKLIEKNKITDININNIGSIKTRHSGGHTVLVSSLAGMSAGAILGVSTADPEAWFGYTAGEGASAFGLLGAIGGGAIGGILSGAKKTETYIINGDKELWETFRRVKF